MARGTMRLRSGTRRNGVWEVRAYVGPHPITGKPRQVSRTVRGGVRAAEDRLRELVAETTSGKHAGSSSTLEYVVARWLDHAEAHHSPTTTRTYRNYFDNRVKGTAVARTPLRRLSPGHFDDLYRELRRAGMAPASVRQVHSILRKALAWAVEQGIIGENPAARARAPRSERRPMAVPTPAEVGKLIRLAEADDPDMAALLFLAATTGMRRGELVALRWRDVDLDRGVLTVSRALIHDRKALTEKDTKTHAVRVVALSEGAVAALGGHLDLCTRRAGRKPAGASYIASYDLGRSPVAPDTLTAYFRRLAEKAGVDAHFHLLRHFAGTQMLGAGVDVKTVQGRLGHKSAVTTLDIYAHALPERDREAAEVLGALMAPKEES